MSGQFAGQALPGTFVDTDFALGAGLQASKMKHQDQKTIDFHLASNGTPVTRTVTAFRAQGPGSLRAFAAFLTVTGTSTSVVFDVKVNGSSVLTSTITIVDTDANEQLFTTTFNAATLNSGDIVTVIMTVSSASGAQGPVALLYYDRDYV